MRKEIWISEIYHAHNWRAVQRKKHTQGPLATIWFQVLPKRELTQIVPLCRFYNTVNYPLGLMSDND